MKKPQKLKDLLEELEVDEEEGVQTIDSSEMVISINDDDLILEAEDCRKVLQSPETVEQLFEALGRPEEGVSVEICMLDVSDEVLDKLNELFKDVEQY